MATTFECTHLPKERNVVADAVSRMSAHPPSGLPSCLSFAKRVKVPPWCEVWRAWEAGRQVSPASPSLTLLAVETALSPVGAFL